MALTKNKDTQRVPKTRKKNSISTPRPIKKEGKGGKVFPSGRGEKRESDVKKETCREREGEGFIVPSKYQRNR